MRVNLHPETTFIIENEKRAIWDFGFDINFLVTVAEKADDLQNQ